MAHQIYEVIIVSNQKSILNFIQIQKSIKMKKVVLKLMMAFIAVAFFACSNLQESNVESFLSELDNDAPLNTLTKKEQKSGWKLLFDGKSFNGWRGYNMPEAPDCWYIEEGALNMLTEGGEESALGIITDKKYNNFALSLEFQLTKAANSGIIFQVGEDPKYTYPYETGSEFQVIDHENWPDTLTDYQICGANYAMYAPIVKPFKPVGDWNQVLLVVDGNKVTQVLNGEVVVEYEKYSDEWNELRNSGKWSDYPDYGKFDEGHISLQNHGTKVIYRNLKIKEL